MYTYMLILSGKYYKTIARTGDVCVRFCDCMLCFQTVFYLEQIVYWGKAQQQCYGTYWLYWTPVNQTVFYETTIQELHWWCAWEFVVVQFFVNFCM